MGWGLGQRYYDDFIRPKRRLAAKGTRQLGSKTLSLRGLREIAWVWIGFYRNSNISKIN